jgi:hypothetical protein
MAAPQQFEAARTFPSSTRIPTRSARSGVGATARSFFASGSPSRISKHVNQAHVAPSRRARMRKPSCLISCKPRPIPVLRRVDLDQCRPAPTTQVLHRKRQGRQNMRPAKVIRDVLNKCVRTLASWPQATDFVCTDCERWARCGMPSSDDCIFKAEQIARGDWKLRRRAKALSLAGAGRRRSGLFFDGPAQ